ncbi:MAG TPA: alcohol dehydrogenase catalytic domain-containing protein [Streptosporangiaceae bacterium]|nr:alcohol dehydrogenase catalytic domain-containing protein [Streptosporangiaceae bacterium]
MKAAAFFATGPDAELTYAEVPTPAIGSRDTLVRVQACAVNHSDLDSWRGTSRWDFTLPWVLGAEFVGTVAEVGDQVTSVRAGDLVTALLQYNCETCERCQNWRPDLCPDLTIFGTGCWGGYGEFVRVPERALIPLRPGDDLLPIAGGQCTVSTAWHMVNRLAGVHPGDLVLVPSASGGVGTALVQCAKLAGARVIATTGSPAKCALIESLGADQVVLRGSGPAGQDDFTKALLDAGGRRFDAVLDTAAGPQFAAHLEALRDDGILVTCGAHAGEIVPLDVVKLFQHGWRIAGFRIAPPDELRAAVDLIRSGLVKIPVDKTFPMSQAAEAHRYLDRQQHVGKVLLTAG